MDVTVYIGISSCNPRKTDKEFGYVIETVRNGKTYTVQDFGRMEGTWHAVTLEAMTKAMERFRKPCRITIKAEDVFILNQLKSIPEWEQNGFKTKKGEEIKNREAWENLAGLMKNHQITTMAGKHEYSSWFQTEFE